MIFQFLRVYSSLSSVLTKLEFYFLFRSCNILLTFCSKFPARVEHLGSNKIYLVYYDTRISVLKPRNKIVYLHLLLCQLYLNDKTKIKFLYMAAIYLNIGH